MTAPEHLILCGDVRKLLPAMPAGSVHCVVTSPPYWGLRDYGTGTWEGGDPACDHRESKPSRVAAAVAASTLGGGKGNVHRSHEFRDTCLRCGAVRIDNQIGLEPTPEEYVATMVAVFREVRRILRDDGCVWINLGDSYNGSRLGSQGKTGQRADRTFTAEGMPPKDVKGLKPKDLCLIPERVAIALQQDGWWVRAKPPWIKCLSGGVRLYARTQKGDMPATLKDLARLDPATVQLWNGHKWTRVVAWNRTARTGEEIEIEFRTGERVACTKDHRWPTARGLVNAGDLVIGDVVETCILPEPERPSMPAKLPSDEIGWLVGFYMAEGCKSNGGLCFSINRKETAHFERIRKIAADFDAPARMNAASGEGATIFVYGPMLVGIVDSYVVGTTCRDKHLTSKAWRRDDVFLRSLLEGYLAGDGHYDAGNNRWRLGFTRNQAWADDLRTLAARLGIEIRLRTSMMPNTATGLVHASFRGEIRFERMGIGGPGRFRAKPAGEVVAVRKARSRFFYDVAVADEPHLFALASGLLTHNSNCMPESVTDRPTTAHESIFLLSKRETYFYDAEAVRQSQVSDKPRLRSSTFAKASMTGNHNNGGDPVWEPNPSGRNRRTSDWFIESLDEAIAYHEAEAAHLRGVRDRGGMLVADDGTPLALRVASEPWKGAHFAVFPRRLVEPMVRAGTSEAGCCPECGAGWVRETDRNKPPHVDPSELDRYGNGTHGVHRKIGSTYQKWLDANPRRTVGWKPSCECWAGGPIPCTVFDPFFGAGTTGVVADALGRRVVGMELNPAYAAMAARRIARPHAPVERPPAPARGRKTFFDEEGDDGP